MGVSIRFCSFEGANENVWHILEVIPDSPADLAGLRSFTDYIVGSDSILHESEDLFTLIESHEGRSLKLYVYNSVDDACREVSITPNSNWGGDGSLGCGIGYGYLHRIPVRVNLPSTTQTQTSNLPQTNQIEPPLRSTPTPVFNPPQNVYNTSEIFHPPPSGGPNPIPANLFTHAVDTHNKAAQSEEVSQTPVSGGPQDYSVSVPPPSSIPQFVSTTVAPIVTQNIPLYNPAVSPTTIQMTAPYDTTASPTVQTSVPMYNTSVLPTEQPNVGTYNYPSYTTQMPVFSQYSPTNTFDSTPVTSSVTTQPLIFDPTIAAASAQQLLSGNKVNSIS